MILAIYGTGGTGKEVAEMAAAIGTYEDIVFIDDTKPECTINSRFCYPFSSFSGTFSSSQAEIVIAVGTPHLRAALFEKVVNYGYTPATLIHPQANVARSVQIHRGCVIHSFCFISCDVVLAENVYIQPQAYIAHDCTIGQNTIVSAGAKIAGNCIIGQNVYIGLQAAIREKTTIGKDTVIGMSSCVTSDIPDNVVAYGVPASIRGQNNNRSIFK